MKINDETLMAFADGELGEAEAAGVSAAVAADPELAARVEMFRRSREVVAEVLRQQGHELEQDAALVARIRVASAPASSSRIVSFPRERRRQDARPFRLAFSGWKPAAIAASLMLAVGLGWMSGLFGNGPSPSGTLDPQFIARLESLPSGQTASESGTEFTAIATFRATDGTLCREYEVRGGERTMIAIACRDAEGWRNRVAMEVAAAGDNYAPASGAVEKIDAFLAEIGAGQPLTLEEEAAALATLR